MKDTWDRTFLLDRCLLPPWNSNSNLFEAVFREKVYIPEQGSAQGREFLAIQEKKLGTWQNAWENEVQQQLQQEGGWGTTFLSGGLCDCVCGSSRSESRRTLLTAIVGSISKLRTNLSVHGIVLHLFTSSIIVLLSRRTTTKKMKSSCLSYCPILTSWNWQPGDNIIVTGWSDTSMHRQCTSVLR